jgi:hypothetical protein
MSEADRIAFIALDVLFGAAGVAATWMILAMWRRYRGRDSRLDRFLLGEPKHR